MIFNIYDLFQLIGGLIISIGYLPQLIQIIKTKSVQDLNIQTFVSIFLSIVFFEVYAIHLVFTGSGLMFLVTNTASLILSGTLCFLILLYRNKK